MVVFNLLVQRHGLWPTASGFVPLSMAESRLSKAQTTGD
jgi:hypothetical protein